MKRAVSDETRSEVLGRPCLGGNHIKCINRILHRLHHVGGRVVRAQCQGFPNQIGRVLGIMSLLRTLAHQVKKFFFHLMMQARRGVDLMHLFRDVLRHQVVRLSEPCQYVLCKTFGQVGSSSQLLGGQAFHDEGEELWMLGCHTLHFGRSDEQVVKFQQGGVRG
jgi:hypothetical protein